MLSFSNLEEIHSIKVSIDRQLACRWIILLLFALFQKLIRNTQYQSIVYMLLSNPLVILTIYVVASDFYLNGRPVVAYATTLVLVDLPI